MIDLRSVKLKRIDDLADVEAFLEWLKQPREVLAFDTETTGLDWYKPSFRLRLVQFGDCDTGWAIRADRWGWLIEHVFTTYEGDFVGHNSIGFDSHVLESAGFSLPPIDRWHDTLMMSRIIDSRGFHDLGTAAEKYLGVGAGTAKKIMKTAQQLHGFKDIGDFFAQVSYDVPAYAVYSANDVVLTARLYVKLRPMIEEFQLAYEREIGAWHVTVEHEGKGLPVDLAYARALQTEYYDRLEIIKGQLQALGIHNPNSKAQKLAVLTVEGFEPDDFTETGEAKLDKSALEKFASPTALLLMEHSRIEGWLTKYINKVLDDSYNGVSYPSFNPFGARTGRQAAFGPPVQQLPGRHEEAHKIRRMFIPREDEELWSIDYDGQENRLLAHFSGDAALTRLIMEGGDIHRYTASVVYGIPEEDVTKEQRSLVKNVVYAEQYGAGLKKLAKMLGMTIEEVKVIKQGIADAYPGVTAWKKKVEEEARYRWQTEGVAYAYTWGGRKVYADQYEDTEPKYYTLANYILQGSGADILKCALNRIAAAGLSHYIYLPIHDELLFSLPTGPEGRDIADNLARLMTFSTEFSIPLTCSPEGPFPAWSPH